MSWKEFFMNLILIVAMVLGCAYAAREGMLSAIKHADEQRAAMWTAAKGETHAR